MKLSTPQALRVADANLGVYVHPSNSKKIQQALCRQLSIALFTFNETFDGVLLAYLLDPPKKTAKILPGLIPYFCVTVKAKLLLFSPKADMLLEGKVVKLSKESIYVIILGFCAAVITSEDIREEFNYKTKDGVGIFSNIYHKRHVIKQGTMLRLSVKSFDEEMLHISGSLIPPGTGCVRWMAKHGRAEGLEVDRSVKKQSKRGREINMEQELELLNEGLRRTLREMIGYYGNKSNTYIRDVFKTPEVCLSSSKPPRGLLGSRERTCRSLHAPVKQNLNRVNSL